MVQKSIIVCAIGFVWIVSGCSGASVSWPKKNGYDPAEWERASQQHIHQTEIGFSLHHRLEAVKSEMETLAANGGLRAVAADMTLLERSVIVIKREIISGLYTAAEKRLFAAEVKLSSLKGRTTAFRKNNPNNMPVTKEL